MKDQSREIETTSRRNFTKAMVTAAVAAPIAASIVGCRKEDATRLDKSKRKPQMFECFPTEGTPEEHIPPMGFDGGGGSLIIESKNELSDVAVAYNYVEDKVEDKNRFGELEEVRVISELQDPPYLRDIIYTGFPDGSQLLFWYQKILSGECQYDFGTPYATEPDVRINGGKGIRYFKLTVKSKLDARQPTYKCARPHRYRHPDSALATNHFRIGRWRVVGPDAGTIYEDSVSMTDPRPEYFRLYVTFGHFQPD